MVEYVDSKTKIKIKCNKCGCVFEQRPAKHLNTNGCPECAKLNSSLRQRSNIVDFVELHSGEIPKYECKQPQDLVDTIIQDLKNYNKSLIYEDKSLAQQIEKYLQDRRNMEKMRADKEQAQQEGSDVVQLQDDDYVEFKESHDNMIQHDQALDQALIEEEFNKRRVNKQ